MKSFCLSILALSCRKPQPSQVAARLGRGSPFHSLEPTRTPRTNESLRMNARLLAVLFLATAANAQDRSAFVGEWRGQAQYQATVGGVVDGVAHAVTNMVIAVEADGRVRGASTENGCRMLGIAMPYVAPTVLTLDVTLSGCQYAGLNRRFSGTLASYPKDRYVVLQLQAIQVGVGKVAGSFDVKATIRR